jgi:aminoglycoside/choline kinase family phosphotransferase
MTRDEAIEALLRQTRFAGAVLAPLAQDGSFRRYLRAAKNGETAVVMDAPPPEDVHPFLAVGEHLRAIGLSAPRIIAADQQRGILLLEDFGDAVFSANPAPPETLFDAAVDALAAMQRAAPPDFLPAWLSVGMAEAAFATLFAWWWPAAFGAQAPDAAKHDFTAALAAMLAPLDAGPRVFVHRDYFVANLMWLPEREGISRTGILDFQTAAIGHPAYDLASLTQNTRAAISEPLRERAIARYLQQFPAYGEAAFRNAYWACAAQRHLRVACLWVRLAKRDGKPRYLAYGPRTWDALQTALEQPACLPLKQVMDHWIPAQFRRNPDGLAA